MSEAPIGIFDSGVGGLSILNAIQERLPNENLIYFADSKYAPYGKLDEARLKERCLFIANFFHEQNTKAMVIACNTATALMAEWLRAEYSIPIIAIEPAIKPATLITKTNKIGVFATSHTLSSQRYQNLKNTYAKGFKVFESHCLGFVEQVELGELETEQTIGLIKRYLQPMLNNNIDTLVLGCTHYPFLKNAIQKVAAETPLTIVDNANAVSLQLSKILNEQGILNSSHSGRSTFYSSLGSESHNSIFSRLLSSDTKVNYIAD